MNKHELQIEVEGELCTLDFAWSLELIKTKNKFGDVDFSIKPLFRGAKIVWYEKEMDTGGIIESRSERVELIAEIDGCQFGKPLRPTGASYNVGYVTVYFDV